MHLVLDKINIDVLYICIYNTHFIYLYIQYAYIYTLYVYNNIIYTHKSSGYCSIKANGVFNTIRTQNGIQLIKLNI